MKTLALLTAAAVTLFSVAALHKPTEYRTARAKPRRRHRLLPKASAGNWGDRPLCRSLSFSAGMSAIGDKADIGARSRTC